MRVVHRGRGPGPRVVRPERTPAAPGGARGRNPSPSSMTRSSRSRWGRSSCPRPSQCSRRRSRPPSSPPCSPGRHRTPAARHPVACAAELGTRRAAPRRGRPLVGRPREAVSRLGSLTTSGAVVVPRVVGVVNRNMVDHAEVPCCFRYPHSGMAVSIHHTHRLTCVPEERKWTTRRTTASTYVNQRHQACSSRVIVRSGAPH